MQQKNCLSLIVVAFSLFLLSSCEKDVLTEVKSPSSVTPTAVKNIFNVSDQEVQNRSGEGELTRTTLGARRNNPFTVVHMQEAQQSLYTTAVHEIIATDLYVKFLPANWEELKRLYRTEEFFYDFPLEYEVVEMGDYYQELAVDELPTLYAIVDPGFDFSGFNYELLEELYLDKSDPLLMAESFRLNGLSAEIPTYVFPQGIKDFDISLIPIEPDCPPGCVPVLRINEDADPTHPVNWEWYCDCYPDNDEESVYTINDCGCEVFSNQRKPGGCIKVEDTQLSVAGDPETFEKVRRVKVTMKDSWFTEDETWTNDSGCWKINDEYRGRAWMWIRFQNPRCSVRAEPTNNSKVMEWLSPAKDYVGRIWGPNFNDIEVNYHMWSVLGSQAHRFWGAATVNNAVHEFYDLAPTEGINLPPGQLRIFTGTFEGVSGFALMADKMGPELTLLGIGQGIPDNHIFILPFGQLIDVFTASQLLLTFAPDVYIPISLVNSDRLKKTAYHEIAHASHFTQVGPIYWKNLVVAEVAANGHGDVNSNDAGRIAVCESWAEHVGHVFADEKYEITLETSINGTWLQLLDKTWNESPDHIPIGLYLDLIDTGAETNSFNQTSPESTMVVDNVSGFTNEQLFSSLTLSTITVDQFRIKLINNHLNSTGNTIQQLNDLFNSY